MKKATKKILGFISIAIAFSFILGCSLFSSKGTISLSITDAPIADDASVEGVFITITGISYNLNDEWIVDSDFGEHQLFNLLELTNGQVEPLSNLAIESGIVSQIRFMLDTSECYIVMDPDGEADGIDDNDVTTDLSVNASVDNTGYKAVGEFTVPMNGTVEITADFDVRKSIVKKGNTDTYTLKPTIRLIVNNEAGSIEGTFNLTSSTTYDSYTIFAYEDGEYVDSEATANADSDEDPLFPKAITSSQVIEAEEASESDSYILPFLAAGTYDLIITGVASDGTYTVLGEKADVVVQSEEATTANIDIQ